MAHEDSSSNHDYYSQFPEGYPQAGLFNLSAMSDEQITMLGRVLDQGHERMADENARLPQQEQVSMETAAILLDHLGADIALMATTSPERGKAFLSRLANSDNLYDRNLAAASAVPLALSGDYEFARNVLFNAYRNDLSQGTDLEGMADARVKDLIELLRHTRPDQAVDLERQWDDLDTPE
jgi:hypothetical protein